MRLITRSDFDGLACGILLKYLGVIDTYCFVHPKDIQDGLVEVNANDCLANVPYVEGCGLWFDHHSSENERISEKKFVGDSRPSPSAAHVVYDFYGGKEKLERFEEMIKFVDKVDSANLTKEEIMNPTGWILLGFIMDPRTGLGRFRNFRISNLKLMENLIDYCSKLTINEILELEDVRERIVLYHERNEQYIKMLKEHSRSDGNVIITDLRNLDTIYTGNRFIIYSLYPEQNISVWIVDGKNKQNVSIAVGYSILNRSSKADVGSLMLKYGGGGHKHVGTCQVSHETAEKMIQEIIEHLKKTEPALIS